MEISEPFYQMASVYARSQRKIDGQEVPIPFNLNSIRKVFPKSIADKLEDKLIEKFGFNVKVPILELRKANDKDLEFLAEYVYQKVFSAIRLSNGE